MEEMMKRRSETYAAIVFLLAMVGGMVGIFVQIFTGFSWSTQIGVLAGLGIGIFICLVSALQELEKIEKLF